jgi:hypothetical protein
VVWIKHSGLCVFILDLASGHLSIMVEVYEVPFIICESFYVLVWVKCLVSVVLF